MNYKIIAGASPQELQTNVQAQLSAVGISDAAILGAPFQDSRGNWYQAVTFTTAG